MQGGASGRSGSEHEGKCKHLDAACGRSLMTAFRIKGHAAFARASAETRSESALTIAAPAATLHSGR